MTIPTMTIPKRFGQYLLSAAVVGFVGIACSSGLKDYTQVDLKVLPTEVAMPVAGDEAVAGKTAEGASAEGASEEGASAVADGLLAVETAVEKRLLTLGLETAEVMTQAPDQVIVRLPEDVPVEGVVEKITKPNRLTLRNQKADTEDELASNIEALQRLLVEQNNLKQTNDLAQADALQPKIDETRGAIWDLFDPGEVTGEMLLDAQAVQMSGFNVWEVRLWFDSQGTQKFADQTKALAGTGRAIGLFLDDVLLSVPTVDVIYVDDGITDGVGTIAGDFTAEAAKALEQQLKDGALPSDLAVVSVTSSAQSESEDAESASPESEETESEETESEETDSKEADSEETD